ncbi:MAG: DNA polymerase III subunit delta, partial [Methylococcaceae bacterium]|nr:DNA polymerase III subunit delta [Methylococcaceae bacterium]
RMRLGAEQIGAGLEKRLFPAYLVCGDEPLQHREALDSIRTACRKSGFSNREVFDAEASFRWDRFEVAARTLSLFSEKKLLELRFGPGLPDKSAESHLVDHLRRVSEDTVLVLSCGKLAKETAKSAWFQAFDRVGVIIQVWPLQPNKMLSWLESRMKARGVRMDRPALRILANRVEGNMLAAAQEIDKLYVLYGSSQLDAAMVQEAVADSAHFDVFDLVDSTLAGQPARSVHILTRLHGEGIAPQIVLWAFARDLRMLAKIRFDLDRGGDRSKLSGSYGIRPSRRNLIDAALGRLELAQIQEFLRRCAAIDLLGKGLAKGDVWEDLLLLSLSIAGISPLDPAPIRAATGNPKSP